MDNETMFRMFPFSYEDIRAAEVYNTCLQRFGNRQTLRAAMRVVCIGNPTPDDWVGRFLHESTGDKDAHR